MKKLMSTVLGITLLAFIATPAFAAIESTEIIPAMNEEAGIIVVTDIPDDEYDLEFYDESEFIGGIVSNSHETSPLAEIWNYYTLKNKTLLSTNYGELHKYITTTWARATGYTVSKSTTIGLTTQSTSGSFTSAIIKGLPGFNGSITASVATNIYADKDYESKLILTKDTKKYSGDLYHVTEYASGRVSETKTGSGYAFDPFDSHYVVIYNR